MRLIRSGVTTFIGLVMVAYGVNILARIPSMWRVALFPPQSVHLTGRLAWVWTIGSPWMDWIMTEINWLTAAAFVVGGVGVIARRPWGIRVALPALVVSAVMLASLLLFAVSAAVGWVVPPANIGGLHRLPVAWQRRIWWWGAIATAMLMAVRLGAFFWLRWVGRTWEQPKPGKRARRRSAS